MTDAAPSGSVRPSADERRATLAIFGRLAWVIAAAWTGAAGIAVAWTKATVLVEASVDRGAIWAFLAPGIVTFVGVLVHVAVTVPPIRWPVPEVEGGRAARTLPAMGLLLGAPASLVLWLRLRSRRVGEVSPHGAFVRLLALPQTVIVYVALWGAVSLAVAALGLAAHYDWNRAVTLTMLALWLASFVPAVALVGIGSRSVLLPAMAGFPSPVQVPPEPPSRYAHRWAAAAVLVGIAIASVPLLSGKLWLVGHHEHALAKRAHAIAAQVQRRVRSRDPQALGAYLATHPEIAVAVGRHRYGTLPAGLGSRTGPVDLDDDGWPDVWVEPIDRGIVVVDVPPHDTVPAAAILVGWLLVAAALLYTVARYARSLDRDISSTTAYVDAVLADQPPPPGSRHAWTAEIAVLTESVSRLIDRMTETNIARYVATEKTREAERVKSQFLANMSHDLRSPLNAILGFSELLLTGIDGELGEEERIMVTQIHDSGRHLLAQIDDILDMAKVEAGRMPLSPEPTPPVTLLSRAMAKVRKDLGEEADIRSQASPGLPPVSVDGFRTVQAVANVLAFAAKHRGDGPIDVTLRAHELDDGRFVLMRVHARTHALSAADLGRARRGFLRLPGQPGLGLGLPLAAALLELQGGRLDIEESTDGIVFTLYLPAPRMSRKLILGETPPVGLPVDDAQTGPASRSNAR